MNFLYPYVLWGLLAMAIPVIIHLFNFRRFRKVYFTNVRFLEELQQQTRRQSQLRHLLVMFLRMLAILALVMAFAQPYIPSTEGASSADAIDRICIHIDNSFSMEASSENGSLLETARNRAREIISAYGPSDRFIVTNNAFEGSQQRWISQEEAMQQVDEAAITPHVRTVSEIIGRQNDRLAGEGDVPKYSYIISDFQLEMADFEKVEADSSVSYRLVPLVTGSKENIYIDSCWFASPVHQLYQGVKLIARIVNDSETDYEKVPLKFMVNGSQKALASFDINAGSTIDVELPFTSYEPGFQYGMLEITDYPITFDDRLFLVYHVAGSIPVLAINGSDESAYLNSLYGSDSAFRFVNNSYKNIDYSRLREYELVILNGLEELSSGLAQELSVFLENSGTIMVIPSPKMKMQDFQEFLQSAGTNYFTELVEENSRVSALDLENPLFSDVFEKAGIRGREMDNTDLPQVKSFFNISRGGQTAQVVLMSMLNGRSFMTLESAGRGQVYLLAVPLDETYSNFARHAIFVPAFFRVALLSAATYPLYYTIGKDVVLEMPNAGLSGDMVYKISSLDGSFEFIPGQQNQNRRVSLRVMGQVNRAGQYFVHEDQDTITGISFNYNRQESAMKFATTDEITAMTSRYSPGVFQVLEPEGKTITETIKDMNQGTLLWKLFIILALVFLGIEIFLLRFWKTKR